MRIGQQPAAKHQPHGCSRLLATSQAGSRTGRHQAAVWVHITQARRCQCGAAKGSVFIIAEDLAKSHDGERQLFKSLTFSVCAGDKIAVVGANGAGKSSLLKLIAGMCLY